MKALIQDRSVQVVAAVVLGMLGLLLAEGVATVVTEGLTSSQQLRFAESSCPATDQAHFTGCSSIL